MISVQNNYAGEAVCGGLMAVSTVAQTNEILQMIQIIICSVAALIGLGLTVFRIIITYKQAKKDGVIDDKEAKEIADLVDEAKETIKHE